MKLDFSTEIGAAARDLSDLNNFLKKEMQYHLSPLKSVDTFKELGQEPVVFILRSMVTGNVTLIDALCSLMKQMVLAIPKSILESTFSREEILLLRDQKQNSTTGEVWTSYQNAKDNVKFSFCSFSQIFAPNFKLDLGSAGWASYLKLLDIRNRITHPKSYQDQLINMEDYAVLRTCDTWFTQSMSALLSEVKKENPWLAR